MARVGLRPWLVGVALTPVVIVLAVQNTERAHPEFLGWDTSTPLVVILLVAALVGVLFEFAGLLWRHRRWRHIAKRQEFAAQLVATASDPSITPRDVRRANTTETKDVMA